MRYYKLWNALYEGDAVLRASSAIKPPFTNWIAGTRWVEAPPEPLLVEVEEGARLLPYYRNPFPIMKRDLLAILRGTGVRNLDDYAVIIRDPRNGKEFEDYRAVNVIGSIAAVDEELSEAVELDESGKFGKFYDEIVVDESKTRGALVFRLAESLDCFVVAERVRDAMLMYEDQHGLRFTPLYVTDDEPEDNEEDE